jgi:hypothetical protein
VKRAIDGLAAVKMNVFHWHLSDDQGFRMESKKFPLLHQKGSDGLFYTQAQVRDVIALRARSAVCASFPNSIFPATPPVGSQVIRTSRAARAPIAF